MPKKLHKVVGQADGPFKVFDRGSRSWVDRELGSGAEEAPVYQTQTQAGVGNDSSFSVGAPSELGEGDLILIFVGLTRGVLTGLSSTGFTPRAVDGGGNVSVGVLSKIASDSEPVSWTVSRTTSASLPRVAWVCMRISGVNQSDPVDDAAISYSSESVSSLEAPSLELAGGNRLIASLGVRHEFGSLAWSVPVANVGTQQTTTGTSPGAVLGGQATDNSGAGPSEPFTLTCTSTVPLAICSVAVRP